MFHTEGFWLRTLRLNPLKPFGSRCCVAALQAEKHRSALPTGPIQASGALPGHGIAQHQPRLGSLRRRAVPDARLELSSRWLGWTLRGGGFGW